MEYGMAIDADENDRQELIHVYRERAKALTAQPEICRSTLMTTLIAESIALGVSAEDEYFMAAYDDPTGRVYWDAHLSEPMRIGAFAYLLSVHLRYKPEQLEDARVAITRALRDAAAVGERLFVGDIAPLIAFDTGKRDFSRLLDVKVRPRAAADWLLSKPKQEHLVPCSLRSFLEKGSVPVNRPRPLTRRIADRFAAEFMEQEKRAGRRPRINRLEAAATEANLRGGRQYLRDAFHRISDVVVKEGRPSKLAE